MGALVVFLLWLVAWISEAALIVWIMSTDSTLGIVASVILVLMGRFSFIVFSQVLVDMVKEME